MFPTKCKDFTVRITIKLKLAVVFAVIILLTGGMASLAIFNLSSLNAAVTHMVAGPIVDMKTVADLSGAFNGTVRAEKNAILNQNPAEIAEFVKSMKDRQQQLDGFITALSKSADPDVQAKANEIRAIYDQYMPLQLRVADLATQNTVDSNNQASALTMGAGRDFMNKALKVIDEVNVVVTGNVQETDEATDVQYLNSRMLLISATIALTLFSIAAAVWISLNISRGLRRAVELADAVSIGDLNYEIAHKSNDEIKDLVNSMQVMTSNLRNTAGLADKVADGDLTVEPTPLSGKRYAGFGAAAHGRAPAWRRCRCPVRLGQRFGR